MKYVYSIKGMQSDDVVIRDWSLITGRGGGGGLQNGRGWSKWSFTPTQKGGGEGGGVGKALAMLKGGTTSFELVLTREPEVLAIVQVMGGTKSFHSFKGGRGAQKVVPCLEGGGCKQFQTHDFPIL